jgi:CubicO group peptidase (beta-lactamase class C family)
MFFLIASCLLLCTPSVAAPITPPMADGVARPRDVVTSVDTVATELGKRLDSVLLSAERRGFSGVVRVEKGGALLLAKGYGLADRARGIPFDAGTLVQIGSNTKDFTLVALLRLQARGRLSLRDSLGKYFPDAPADKRAITLQQLVDHRAGFPIGLGGDFDTLSRQEFLRAAFAAPLRTAPGTHVQYSNTGYSLLAAVIERVTGTSYDRYVRDDLLAPLHLAHTGFMIPQLDSSRVAHGYRDGIDQGSILEKPHAPDGPYWNLRGNGGMVSTVGEMHAFYHALFDGDGLLARDARGGRFDPEGPVALAGSDLVSFFLFERMPSAGVEIIVATNSTAVRGPAIRDSIARALGLPSMAARRMDAAAPPPAGAKQPLPAVAALVRDIVASVNSGDSATIARVVADRFTADSGEAGGSRVERLATMHDRLGRLTLGAMWMDPDGSVHASVTSAAEGAATFIFQVADGPPPRVRALGVLVGG